MYLTAFLHRNEFFEIANRWLSDNLEPHDPLQITKIITYDSFVAWETLLLFMDDLLKSIATPPIHKKSISNKKELKDFICNTRYPKTERIEALISDYSKVPEFFYIGLPIAGYIYHDPLFEALSICRFKRVKRIAEKSSRYAKMHILEELQAAAHEITKKRVHPVPPATQIPPELLVEAEKEIMMRIKERGVEVPVESMTIKDILGIKVVDHGYGEEGLESAVEKRTGARIIEKERHTGNYNAVHYVVELQVDPPCMIDTFKNNENHINFTQRGLPADTLCEDFQEFIGTGAEAVQLDLILTTFEELVESEIGRSMHESRIFEQRHQQIFHGNILINIEYIIEYLFAVGLSPTVNIEEIPIKVWGRYLPDTLSYKIRELYHMPEYSLIGHVNSPTENARRNWPA
jgi:hypothetical protein